MSLAGRDGTEGEGGRRPRAPHGELRRLGRLEWRSLALLLAVLAGLWSFLRLTGYALAERPHEIEERVLLALRARGDPSDPIGPVWFEELVRDLTAFGSFGALLLFTGAVLGFLLLEGRRRAALAILVATSGGYALSFLLKDVFDRARPALVPHGASVLLKSFPSGHSMMAAVTYLTLGAMLARVQRRRRTKVYIHSVALGLTLLVGLSRLYLGVHWPTDVLAGWMAGGLWALACLWVMQRLQTKGSLEAFPPE